jgi:methylated-DNA-[protein]-cysteine S-methyltransferase
MSGMAPRTDLGAQGNAAHAFFESPVGELRLVADAVGLIAILWPKEKPGRVRLPDVVHDASHPVLVETGRQLQEYFAGSRVVFDLPLAPRGTLFQQRVWQQLLAIPYGETRSYGQIARTLGNPNAMRAVGAANGRNPISIVTPCHRVIASDGTLAGFAGTLAAKRYLLDLEQRAKAPSPGASRA